MQAFFINGHVVVGILCGVVGFIVALVVVRKNGGRKDQHFVHEELRQNRAETLLQAKQLREEVTSVSHRFSEVVSRQIKDMADVQQSALKGLNESLLNRIGEMSALLRQQMDAFSQQLMQLTTMNEQKMEQVRSAVELRLGLIQSDTAQKLEQMRLTVDEKLSETLGKRLGESFKNLNEHLDRVNQRLGEMQVLATDVGGLKKILSNIKTRGTWGEVQLGNVLDEILTQDQYAKNVTMRPDSTEYVEFAIKLPGKDDQILWLPIDAKFPLEDYEKLLEAQDQAHHDDAELLGKSLEKKIKDEARKIRDKYVHPPYTTDFGILFLPTEGLYAEVVRRPGLFDFVQREFRITITGPTTISAFLNSLRMGFQTLAIEKHASDVWNLLSGVKTEFRKFGVLLEKADRQLQTVSKTIGEATTKTKAIGLQLKQVHELPTVGAGVGLPEIEGITCFETVGASVEGLPE